MKKFFSVLILICIGLIGYSQQWGKGYIPHGRNIVDVGLMDIY